jgi:hypothetical protein
MLKGGDMDLIQLNKIHKICLLLFVILVIFSMTGCEKVNREDAIKEMKSTDLSNENIEGIELGMFIIDENFIQKHGHFAPHPDNEYFAPMRNFDQYWNKQIIMSIDRVTQDILSISILEDNNTTSTTKGIKMGASIDDVITTYGEDYYKYKDSGQNFTEIGYVDHQKNLMLSFIYFNDKVTSIKFSYAFDRLNWNE